MPFLRLHKDSSSESYPCHQKHQGADCAPTPTPAAGSDDRPGVVVGNEGETGLSLLSSCWELIRCVDERIVIFLEFGVRVEVVEALTLLLVLNGYSLMQNCLSHYSHWRLRVR